jgi:hypothetical protein
MDRHHLIAQLTRSSLHRCLQRQGVSRSPDVEGDKLARKKSKAYPIGFFHIDIAEVQKAVGKLYLYVSIDRTSKFAFAWLNCNKTPKSAARGFQCVALPSDLSSLDAGRGS